MGRQQLIEEAKRVIRSDDRSHDFNHAMRVLHNAEFIASREGGDLEVIVPAALFHDAVVYPKHDPRSKYSADESSALARDILVRIGYAPHKIGKIVQAIKEHSYGKGIRPELLESQIVQDADRLEATGALAIMRTFCSTGQMKRPFYNNNDPFCAVRVPDPKTYAVDLFYERLLVVREKMNTGTARTMAEERTRFLHGFIDQLKTELEHIA